MSNRSQWSAYDRGSCTEEPCEIERLTHGSEVAAGVERPLPTITVGRAVLVKKEAHVKI